MIRNDPLTPMKIKTPIARFTWIVLLASIFVTPLQAQTRRPGAQQKTPAKPVAREVVPTFETLLAADSFKLYGEIRGVGQLIRSQAINDLLDPLMKLSSPPKEFKTLVTWLHSHADQLVTSRLLFASWPSRPKLPQFIAAIEFSSPEEAQKFEPRLRQFLPQIIPSPSPSPSPSAAPPRNQPATESAKPSAPPAPPYVIKQAGTLVLISTSTFTFKNLRPTNSKLLVEDPEFRQVRDRFASEQTFLYFDIKRIIKEEEEEQLKRQKQYEEEQKKREAEVAQQQKDAEATEAPEVVSPDDGSPAMDPPPDTLAVGEYQVTTPGGTRTVVAEGPSPMDLAFSGLMGSFFRGSSKWPVAIGLGIALDNDSLNAKVLLVNPPEAKGSILPFAPQLISGPHITPSAASILPANTEMFATLSLDYGLIHDGILKAHADMVQAMEKERLESLAKNPQATAAFENQPASPFAAYERLLGLKIKEDLLPLLGNEIAISLPLTEMFKETTRPAAGSESIGDDATTVEKKAKPAPIVAIAVKDREGIKTLIPKVIESSGLKGAGLIAQTEKRDDTELISYANAFGYALVGDFLVVSTDVNAIRHVVDSYLNHQTLGSDTRFRNSTRWQPRQVLGQVYIAETMSTVAGAPLGITEINDQMREIISRLSPYNEPMTYALYNEGLGPIHEVHIPKNLLILFAAGFAAGTSNMSLEMNESMAQTALHSILGAQETYKTTEGNGNYGTLDQLTTAQLISKEILQDRGYKIDMTVSGTRFEVRAVPTEYGKSGKRSFFIDETGVLRAGDLGGGPATISDKPVQ